MTTLPRTRLARTLAAVTIAAASFGLTNYSLLGNVVALVPGRAQAAGRTARAENQA